MLIKPIQRIMKYQLLLKVRDSGNLLTPCLINQGAESPEGRAAVTKVLYSLAMRTAIALCYHHAYLFKYNRRQWLQKCRTWITRTKTFTVVVDLLNSKNYLVHGQVTIIFVVSAGLSVCLCRVFLSRLWSDFDETWTYVTCLALVVSPRI